jgi:outer membrane immunogenic protein
MTRFVSLIAACAFLGSLCTAPASAAESSSVYVGAAYSSVTIDDVDGEPAIATAIIGFPVMENLSLEGRIGTGVKSVYESTFVGAVFVTGELKIDNYYGAFVRANLPAGDSLNLYLLGGYGTANVSVRTNFGSGSSSESSGAYGAGAEVVFGASKSHHFGVEWARYFKDANALSAIYRYKF